LARVVLVSNRVVDLSRASQAGGVAVVLADVLRGRTGLWFGWNGKLEEASSSARARARPQITQLRVRIAAQSRAVSSSIVATLPLTADEYADYYLGYSNSVLWPVFHNRLDLARFDAGFYRRYVEVNERFAEALTPLLEADDIIWVHDYHLLPFAACLRRRGVENPIGFFLHIPVPPSQTFLAIPEHRELASSLAAYDLVGLQTAADVANLIKVFEDSISGRILQDGRIKALDRPIAVESFPVGIIVNDFTGSGETAPLTGAPSGAVRMIGVDRLDYTKGLPQKFAAYGRFLERYPHYRGKVVLSQIAPPTRESVEAYTDIRRTLEALSGKINGMFGELDWVPIHYIYRSVPRRRLRDIYHSSRIGLFTPLRDGMNLVAKEYIAAQDPEDPGVVILSRFAGAAEQLTDALIVNPYNLDEIADAIHRALEMGKSERILRHTRLLEAVKQQDTRTWAISFLTALEVYAAKREAAREVECPDISRALRQLSASATAFHLDTTNKLHRPAAHPRYKRSAIREI